MPEVYKPTPAEIAEVLRLHKLYLEADPAGKRANLRGSNLSRSDLRGSDLSRSNLRGSNLRGSNLSRSNLSDSDLSGSDLSDSDLSDSDLRGSNLSRSNLRGSDLRGSDLRGSNLRGSNLSGSDLRGSNLSGSDLSDSDLSRSNLRGSNLSGSDLRGSNLRGSNLRDGETFETYLKDVVPALLTAGGKSLEDIVTADAWNCHSWNNCPMACAFGVHSYRDTPPLLRPRVTQFVQLFDARLIPAPTRDAAGNWRIVPPAPKPEPTA